MNLQLSKKSNLSLLIAAATAAISTFAAAPGIAATITFTSENQGWYREDGLHFPGLSNYLAGSFSSLRFHNWGVFDLSSVTRTIESATLSVNTANLNISGNRTWSLFDVTTNLTSLTDGTGGVAAFNDLGGGVSFGNRTIASNEANTEISVALNNNAIGNLNAFAGGLWGIGGACLDCGNGSEFLFGASQDNWTLTIQTAAATSVPEPSSILATMATAAGLSALGRKRKLSKSAKAKSA